MTNQEDTGQLPVPPNCPYFSECDEGPGRAKSVHFEIHGSDLTQINKGVFKEDIPQVIRECLCHCAPEMRPVIASIARCWWEDTDMPTEQEWLDDAPVPRIYKAWLHRQGNARKNDSGDMMTDCQVWGKKQ